MGRGIVGVRGSRSMTRGMGRGIGVVHGGMTRGRGRGLMRGQGNCLFIFKKRKKCKIEIFLISK